MKKRKKNPPTSVLTQRRNISYFETEGPLCELLTLFNF